MLNAVSVALDAETLEQLKAELSRADHVKIVRNFTDYPPEGEFTRYLQTSAPAIAFLNMKKIGPALALARAIDRTGSGTQVVALDSSCDPAVLLQVMQAGIREFASIPFVGLKLNDSVERIAGMLERKPVAVNGTQEVYAFLPAKPGGGTTTIAINIAAAIARISKTGTLLADLDLNLGMISFQLKMTNAHSITDALGHADHIDDSIWSSVVTTVGDLDVLCSGRLNPDFACDPVKLRKVLEFARRSYETICIDLSGNMEPYSIEALQQAKEIFLVCTPDVSSLHLACAKTRFLRDTGVGDRVSVLMNRSEKRNLLSVVEIEKVLGVPIRFSFANDPRHVGDALISGTHVDTKSDLGRQFEAMALSLRGSAGTNSGDSARKPVSRRFVDFFSVAAADSYAKTVWTGTKDD